MILLFLLVSLASAHVPVFDSTSEAYKISEKSWGVYRELKKHESFSVFLDVPKDENISFSVNLAGSQDKDFNSDTKYIQVTLLGHNASQIPCDPTFTGWGYEDHTSRRLDAGQDQTQLIPLNYGKLHFEPFGVGYYRSLAACQGKVPVADSNFTVTVKALEVIEDTEEEEGVLRISIGAGMAESFAVDEIIFLPITITRTWLWDQYFLYFIFSHIIGLVIILGTLIYTRKMETRDIAKYLTCALLFHNILIYSLRFLRISRLGNTSHADDAEFDDMVNTSIWIGLSIHIILPFLFLVFIRFSYKIPEQRILGIISHIIFIFYCLVLLIQTFWLGALAALVWFYHRNKSFKGKKKKYERVPDGV